MMRFVRTLRTWARTRSRKVRRDCPHFRPNVEILESRLVPTGTVYRWVGYNSTSWTLGSNWDILEGQTWVHNTSILLWPGHTVLGGPTTTDNVWLDGNAQRNCVLSTSEKLEYLNAATTFAGWTLYLGATTTLTIQNDPSDGSNIGGWYGGYLWMNADTGTLSVKGVVDNAIAWFGLGNNAYLNASPSFQNPGVDGDLIASNNAEFKFYNGASNIYLGSRLSILDGGMLEGNNQNTTVTVYDGVNVETQASGTINLQGQSFAIGPSQLTGSLINSGNFIQNSGNSTIALKFTNSPTTSPNGVTIKDNATLTLPASFTDGPDTVSYLQLNGQTTLGNNSTMALADKTKAKITGGSLNLANENNTVTAYIKGSLLVAGGNAVINLNNGGGAYHQGILDLGSTGDFTFTAGTWNCEMDYASNTCDTIKCANALLNMGATDSATLSATTFGVVNNTVGFHVVQASVSISTNNNRKGNPFNPLNTDLTQWIESFSGNDLVFTHK